MDRTMELARREAGRYNINAEFRINPALPSFEATAKNPPMGLPPFLYISPPYVNTHSPIRQIILQEYAYKSLL